MTGTITGSATAIGLFQNLVRKYSILSSDALILWDGIRTRVEDAERSGFIEGFRMAQTIQGAQLVEDAGGEPSEHIPMDLTGQRAEQAFVRMEQGKHGKRLHFNKTAGAMFGGYQKADIYVKEGNLFIYPTNDGAYTVTRAGSAGHVQICCADILDELVTKAGNYPVEKRDNHIIARSPGV